MTHQTAPPPTTVGPSWQLSTGTDCGSKATVTVPPTATTTASSLQLPPDLQAGSISSAPFCPFTPAFPMRCFFVLPQLLAAPLLAVSLFLAPPSMANSHQRSSQHNWIPNAIQLFLEPSNTLTSAGVGLATLLALIRILRKENLKRINELNSLSASIKTLETQVDKINENLNDYINKSSTSIEMLETQASKTNDNLNDYVDKSSASIKMLEIQANKINRNLNDYIVQQKIRTLRDKLEEGGDPEEGKD